MKKSIFTLLLMLATMSMTAQTIDGTWVADEAFRKEMGFDKEEPAMNLMISFDKVKTKKSTKSGDFCVAMTADNDDAEIGKIGVNFFIPGTFNMDGTNVQTVCNAKDAQVKISQLELKDAEMKAAMAASEETRNAMFKLIEAEVKNNGAAEISQIGELATLFRVFKVKFDGNDKMNLIIGDEVIGFNRVK